VRVSAVAPPTRRVSHGKGHSYFLDGSKEIGVTTALGEGFPKPALINWAGKTTASYAVDHWDELAELNVTERYRVLEKARYADRDEAGNAGTQVHRLAQQLAAGAEVSVPEHLEGHVDSYLRFADEWDVKERLHEVVVINRRFRYMGTLDVIGDLADERTWLLDFKTARSGVFAENALQLAGYRNAETYIGADGEEHPIPEVDQCGVVWLRSDGYDLFPLEAGPDEFRIFLYALGIARWRASQYPDAIVIGEALEPPKVEATA
jgi:hypothetical protein